AYGEPAGLELALHGAADRVPLGLRDFSGDAAVGDDLDAPIDELHVDQHAAVVLGVPHAQLAEKLLGARARRESAQEIGDMQRAFDREAQLAGMKFFGLADGVFNPAEDILRKSTYRKPVRHEEMLEEAHHQLPLAPPP